MNFAYSLNRVDTEPVALSDKKFSWNRPQSNPPADTVAPLLCMCKCVDPLKNFKFPAAAMTTEATKHEQCMQNMQCRCTRIGRNAHFQ